MEGKLNKTIRGNALINSVDSCIKVRTSERENHSRGAGGHQLIGRDFLATALIQAVQHGTFCDHLSRIGRLLIFK